MILSNKSTITSFIIDWNSHYFECYNANVIGSDLWFIRMVIKYLNLMNNGVTNTYLQKFSGAIVFILSKTA